MNKIVLGCLFGDEGKGLVTRWLANQEKNPWIIRFSGGPQSAHTVMSRETGISHICSSFGAGVLEGLPTVYVGGYFDICSFVEECKVLESKGIQIPKVYLKGCKKMYPHDVYLGQRGDREKRDGTCGKGIYQAFIRPDRLKSRSDLDEYWKSKGLSEGEISWLWEIYDEALKSKYSKKVVRGSYPYPISQTKIVEGTQGLLLDKDYGFFPHVTPSSTGPLGLENSGILKKGDEIYLVLRSYLTRHGNGYNPKNPVVINNPYETNVYNEWQGEFKIGELETDLIQRALDRHSIDTWQRKYNLKINVVITCLDVHTPDIDGIKKVFTDNLDISGFYGSWGPYSDEIKSL